MCNGISVFWIIVIISGNLVGIVESFWHIVVGELFKYGGHSEVTLLEAGVTSWVTGSSI